MLLVGDFAVRETIACYGSYVLRSDDIDALETVSTASVWAVDKFQTQVTQSADATTSLDQVRNFVGQLMTHNAIYLQQLRIST